MTKTLKIVGVVAFLFLLGGSLIILSGNSYSSNAKKVQQNASSSTAAVASTTAEYVLADVAQHNTASSCWTAINGGVYDVTSWIDEHPGGRGAILGSCGIDSSDAFNGQHGGQRRPAEELAGFKIGTLK